MKSTIWTCSRCATRLRLEEGELRPCSVCGGIRFENGGVTVTLRGTGAVTISATSEVPTPTVPLTLTAHDRRLLRSLGIEAW